MKEQKSRKQSRREFLRNSIAGAGWLALPSIVPSQVLGASGVTPPSESSVRAVIGVGGMGSGHLGGLLGRSDVRVAAVCDVDGDRLANAMKRVEQAGQKCEGYKDYRDVLDRKDIDVVYVVTPPHWHALISIHAAQAGKDVYCEKPMTKFIHEGRAVAETVRRYGAVFHIGTFGRYGARSLRKLIASGACGTPLLIRMNREKYNWKVREWSGRNDLQLDPVPANLDWNMWRGPAPFKPYHPHRCHGSFRGYWDTDGGGFSDMGAHYFDPLLYALGFDEKCPGPIEVEAVAPWPVHPEAVGMWETITYKFGDGTIIRCNSGEWGQRDSPDLPYIEGPKGRLLNDGKTEPEDLFEKAAEAPDPPPMIDFETALKVRRQPGGNAEVSHLVSTILHIGNIAIRLGRKVVYDPAKEEFPGDEEANRFVNIPMRAPWHL